MVTPLRKLTLNGERYVRNAGVEAKLKALEALSQEDLVARCELPPRHPGWVEDECVLHFVRSAALVNAGLLFERLYRALVSRALRLLPKAESSDGTSADRTRGEVRETAFDRFVEMLVKDRNTYQSQLDFFEIRFASALANLRRDAQDRVWREEKRMTKLDQDESVSVSAEVELSAIRLDPFEASRDDDYRTTVDQAIDNLPQQQRRIVEMLRLGVPISSSDPDAITIAKALGRSEKTIRTHRDLAFEAIRAHLAEGESA